MKGLHFLQLLVKEVSKDVMLILGGKNYSLKTDLGDSLLKTTFTQLNKTESYLCAGLEPSPLCSRLSVERGDSMATKRIS